MGVYALINVSSSIIENCIVWDGIQYLETGSDYVLIEVSESIELTGSYTKPPELYGTIFDGYVSGSFTGSFSGSLTGSFNGYSGDLSWVMTFPTSSWGTGSYTGSFTGSLLGTSSNASTASYVTNIKSGKVTSGEWVVELVGNNYTASVLLSSSYLNDLYAVSLTCGADIRTLSVTNKTPSGFDINSNSTSAMTDDVYWVTVPYNNA
jgi:hypothetical protein